MLNALNHAANECDVAVQMARGVADDSVELCACARVGREVPANADHAVAVDWPISCGIGCADASDGKSLMKAGPPNDVIWRNKNRIKRT